MTLTQFIPLFVPTLTAISVAVITYLFAIKSKRSDLLYASKIPAFKEIASKLTAFKTTCLGRVAEYKGLDFSPYTVQDSALAHRMEIAAAASVNAIFLSQKDRVAIDRLLNDMAPLCSLELRLASDPPVSFDGDEALYQDLSDRTEELINLLYDGLNLK